MNFQNVKKNIFSNLTSVDTPSRGVSKIYVFIFRAYTNRTNQIASPAFIQTLIIIITTHSVWQTRKYIREYKSHPTSLIKQHTTYTLVPHICKFPSVCSRPRIIFHRVNSTIDRLIPNSSESFVGKKTE